MYNNKEVEQTILELIHEDNIGLSELPNIDLYMDQLLTFLNKTLKSSKGEQHPAFTKTMINNYARKDSVLMQPKDKKYTHYHILSLILIHHLKEILSIDDIKSLFGSMFNDIDDPGDDIMQPEQAYEAFCKFKSTAAAQLMSNIQSQMELVKPEIESIPAEHRALGSDFLLILMLVNQANICQKLAERILNDKFNC